MNNEAEVGYNMSIWFGTIFYYLLNGGKKPFAYFEQSHFQMRNVWTGYFLQMAVIFGLIGLGIWWLT